MLCGYWYVFIIEGQNRSTVKGLIGKKIGMTSIFDATGRNQAVTVIELGPCVVTQVKTTDTDGYEALQLAFGDMREKSASQPLRGHFAAAGTSPKRKVAEFRDFAIDKAIGDTIRVEADAVGSPEPGVFRDKRIRYSRRAGLVGGDVLDGDPSST